MEGMTTFYGPGDDLWDNLEEYTREKMEEPDVEDDCWPSKSRIALEDNCAARGIEFERDWDFFEFN
jgi:hypothetical protein